MSTQVFLIRFYKKNIQAVLNTKIRNISNTDNLNFSPAVVIDFEISMNMTTIDTLNLLLNIKSTFYFGDIEFPPLQGSNNAIFNTNPQDLLLFR